MRTDTRIYMLTIALICSLTACTQHIYAPALYKADAAYQFKPMSSDSIKSANYVQGGIYFGSGVELQDNIFLTNLSFSHATTYQHFAVAYGGYGFLGRYKNYALDDNDPTYFGVKSISGFGLRTSVDYYHAEGKKDYRVGLEGFYSKEFGDYANFRRTKMGSTDIYTDPNTSLFTIGIAAEEITKWTKNPQIQDGYRFFAGAAIGEQFRNAAGASAVYNSVFLYKNLFVSAAYALKFHKALFVIDYQDLSSVSFTLGYTL
jgi:hypothetical protein